MRIINARFPGIDVLLLDDSGRPLSPREWRSAEARELFHTVSHWQLPAAGESPKFEASSGDTLPGIVGTSAAMHRVHRMARLVARHDTPVLLTGPTGTGKELVANAIHELSSRSGKRMVTINCAAIPEALLEAELFGYSRERLPAQCSRTWAGFMPHRAAPCFWTRLGRCCRHAGRVAALYRLRRVSSGWRLGYLPS